MRLGPLLVSCIALLLMIIGALTGAGVSLLYVGNIDLHMIEYSAGIGIGLSILWVLCVAVYSMLHDQRQVPRQ